MLVAIGKAHHFVFDRRAVAWTDPFDHAGVHRAAIEVIADHIMGFLVGVRDVARHLLRMLCRIAHKREDRHWVITVLLRQHAEINGARINTRRRAGFQAADAQRQLAQTARQWDRRRIASTAAAVVIQTNMNFTVKEGTHGQHHGFGAEFEAHLGHGAHDAIVLNDKIFNRLLEDHQVRLVLQRGTYCLTIKHAVSLSAGGAHCRSFAGV